MSLPTFVYDALPMRLVFGNGSLGRLHTGAAGPRRAGLRPHALRFGSPVVAGPTTYAGSEMTPIWG